MKTTESLPVWSLNYCINGDATGLTEEEIAMIDKWMQDWQVEIISPIADNEGNYQPSFSHSPLFGLATDVIDCDIIFHNPNPTNPQQL